MATINFDVLTSSAGEITRVNSFLSFTKGDTISFNNPGQGDVEVSFSDAAADAFNANSTNLLAAGGKLELQVANQPDKNCCMQLAPRGHEGSPESPVPAGMIQMTVVVRRPVPTQGDPSQQFTEH